jgi:hypothetical protein
MPPILAYVSGGFQYIAPDLVFQVKTVIIIAVIIADEGCNWKRSFYSTYEMQPYQFCILKTCLACTCARSNWSASNRCAGESIEHRAALSARWQFQRRSARKDRLRSDIARDRIQFAQRQTGSRPNELSYATALGAHDCQ